MRWLGGPIGWTGYLVAAGARALAYPPSRSVPVPGKGHLEARLLAEKGL
jgi:hypothetical protein